MLNSRDDDLIYLCILTVGEPPFWWGILFALRSHDDVVDGNVNELDEEADESHDGESDGRGDRDLLEFWKNEIGDKLVKQNILILWGNKQRRDLSFWRNPNAIIVN